MNGTSNSVGERATWWQAALMIRGQTDAEQRNLRSVRIWCLVWAIGLLAVTTAIDALPDLQRSFAWLLAIIPAALSLPALLANVRFIRQADEFMRKVQLHGIAIGFATTFIFCMGYHTLERVGAPHLPVIFAAVPLALGWATGSFIVAFRHR